MEKVAMRRTSSVKFPGGPDWEKLLISVVIAILVGMAVFAVVKVAGSIGNDSSTVEETVERIEGLGRGW